MVRHRRALSAGLAALTLTACAAEPPPRVVTERVLVEVPGPTRFIPVDRALLGCSGPEEPGRPAVLEDGIPGGELVVRAQGWEAYARCLEGRLAEIGRLTAP